MTDRAPRRVARRSVGDMSDETDPMVDSAVDWAVAARTANRLLRRGPEVSRSEAFAAVESLRDLADVADEHVRNLTQLDPGDRLAPTRVVDRSAWVQTNADGMARLLGPLTDRLSRNRGGGAVSARLTGAEAGAVLAFLAGKVLGQYDVFGSRGGELLLVAPNIVEAERSLGVDPHDFRLWVCLHECTHRLQFTAVPWLVDHMHSEVAALTEAIELDPKVLRERLSGAMRELGAAVRGAQEPTDGLISIVQSPASQVILDRLTAFMSLVEGHAEYVMDAVGPDVVPSVEAIRGRFNKRRQGTNRIDRIVRRLMGLDAKMRQYADGRVFVREVVDKVGMDGFNAVWTSPETLPRKEELSTPELWIGRVRP